MPHPPEGASKGGRGAQERILRTTVELFARDGIHATGIAGLTNAAHVSTRTLYQHFSSKEALVSAYLRRLESEPDGPLHVETMLERRDISARERLLALFSVRPDDPKPNTVLRGCPMHNAAVETAGTMPDVAALVEHHKRSFIARLIETAAEAGAHDPEAVGRQLAVLFEGARAMSASLNDTQPFEDAQNVATSLIEGIGGTSTRMETGQ
ncbi:TetR/AcrR family transcriptional regulator [Aeromicrobium ginsengisoli]|uniref:TetR/AcrR family transcriptional regulator n=1 Tax=Aeromicrobium ginsengisoli TaxID=363867 RepID=A0A5M4F9C5_9ACTN|nr:TetR/AcrR family transcriptional regulator [Aeromicrobium ginsengisoli]KAA1394308.1 TetR/AcrR family transcriptional regulator [Aeromicrobium ginsengisoli]